MLHIAAHEQRPWNKLADVGAEAFPMGRYRSEHALPAWLRAPGVGELLPWAVLQVIPPERRHEYPPMVARDHIAALGGMHSGVGGNRTSRTLPSSLCC